MSIDATRSAPLAPTPGPAPTAILIRSGEKRANRKKKVAVFLAMLVGLPGLALAATFLFATLSGSTDFSVRSAAAEIVSVTGAIGTGGVTCVNSNTSNPGAFAINPRANRFNINGVSVADPGQCTVTVAVRNAGTADLITARLANVVTPTGWTITSNTVDIPAGEQRNLTVTVAATETAVTGQISGNLEASTAPVQP